MQSYLLQQLVISTVEVLGVGRGGDPNYDHWKISMEPLRGTNLCVA